MSALTTFVCWWDFVRITNDARWRQLSPSFTDYIANDFIVLNSESTSFVHYRLLSMWEFTSSTLSTLWGFEGTRTLVYRRLYNWRAQLICFQTYLYVFAKVNKWRLIGRSLPFLFGVRGSVSGRRLVLFLLKCKFLIEFFHFIVEILIHLFSWS